MVNVQCTPLIARSSSGGQDLRRADIQGKGRASFASAPGNAFLYQTTTDRSHILQVTYDLNQVPSENLLPLRDTLLAALQTYHAAPRTIIIQLSLAIAGLALQLRSWHDPTKDLIDMFGRDPATVPTLLEFLTLLPEEVSGNTRIPITVRLFVFCFGHIRLIKAHAIH